MLSWPRFAFPVRWALLLGSMACLGTDVSHEALAGELATPRDLETIRQRILAPLVRPVDENTVRTYMASLRADGSWPDVNYEDRRRSQWSAGEHLKRLTLLAQAYAAPESDLHHDAALRRAVFLALDYWLHHDFQNSNWWWNQIGVPQALQSTLLLLSDELSPDERSQGLRILQRAKIGMTGQNLVWLSEIAAVRGILQNDPSLVAQAYRRIADEIRVSSGEGIQADGSFHQHGPCLYNHGYGADFAVDCSRIASQVAGTQWAFPPEKISLLSHLVLDGSQWMCRGSASDFGAEGREITRPGQDVKYLRTAARFMLELPTGRDEEFRALIAHVSGKPAPALAGNRHFWRSDLMVHHRPGYYASARMYSRRVDNTDDAHNDEGLKSHHIADGCNLLIRTGCEYAGIFAVWDWQKIPGATIEQKSQLTGSPRAHGERSFVGGVSDGTYGMAAFDFSRDVLSARKSWFFFEDEYVCLGAGITCSSDNPVLTTVNQCRLAGAATVADAGAPRSLDRGEHIVHDPRWIWHDQVACVLLQPAAVGISNETRTGTWWQINHQYPQEPVSENVYSLWIDHGKRPQQARYAYAVVPGIAIDAVASRVERLPVRVVRNDPSVQAVRQEKLGVAGVAFYEPGQVVLARERTLKVDRPCLVLLREFPDRLEISAASPDGEVASVVVETSGKFRGDGVEVLNDPLRSRFTLKLPEGLETGKSIRQVILGP